MADPVVFSLVIPAYREARHLRYNLNYVCSCLDGFHRSYEVIVVDDGSDDDTLKEAVAAAGLRSEIEVRSLPRNAGKGAALLAGVRVSRGTLVGFLDADLDLHPQGFGRFLQIMRRTNGDAVVGSKWHPESRVDYPPLRRLYSRAYYFLVHSMFGLPSRDTQTGIKLFKRDALVAAMDYVSTSRYAFDLDLLVALHRLGYKIVDAPITLEFHRAVGRIRIADVARILIDTFAIYFRWIGGTARRGAMKAADVRTASFAGEPQLTSVADAPVIAN